MQQRKRGTAMAGRSTIGVLVSLALLSAQSLSAQAPLGTTEPGTYIYSFEDGPQQQHEGLTALWDAAEATGCARTATPRIAPLLVPLVLFGFNLLARVIEGDLSKKEERELAAMSSSWSGVLTGNGFPLRPDDIKMKCVVVHRITENAGDGSAYVIGLRRVGATGFAVEGVRGWLGSSGVLTRSGDKLNATVSVAVQYVATRDGANELVTLPAQSIDFEGLTAKAAPVRSDGRVSPVLPVPETTASPTSLVFAVTEANTRLASRKQQIALDQANRAALVEALGKVIEGALTD